MKFRITSTAEWSYENVLFKYGNMFNKYGIEKQGDNAHIVIATLEELLELQKAVGEEIIVSSDEGENKIEIYDYYRE